MVSPTLSASFTAVHLALKVECFSILNLGSSTSSPRCARRIFFWNVLLAGVNSHQDPGLRYQELPCNELD